MHLRHCVMIFWESENSNSFYANHDLPIHTAYTTSLIYKKTYCALVLLITYQKLTLICAHVLNNSVFYTVQIIHDTDCHE